jgi:hypothetical protein
MDSSFNVLLWDCYNVLDSDSVTCQSTFKNGKICNRKCNKRYNLNGTQVFCCTTHFPKTIQKTTANNFKIKSIDSYLLQDIAKEFITRIQELYDQNPVFQQLNSIVIELQPKCNSKMSFVSHILYGKLVELYLGKPNVTIRYVRASQKLRAYTGPIIQCKLKGKYAQQKWLSIQYAKWFLENKFSKEQKEKWLPFFESHTKRDDISDTLLMSINCVSGIIPKKNLTHKNGNQLK